MRKNTFVTGISALFFLASSLIANAGLAVYNYQGSTASIGGGQNVATSHSGYLVIDLPTLSATYVGMFSTGSGGTLKNYYIKAPLNNIVNTQVLGPNGTSYTVLSKSENPSSRYTGSILHFEGATGLNSQITIKTSGGIEMASLPTTLNSPVFVITRDNGNNFVGQSNGVYSFNSATTLASNNSAKSLAVVVSELENSYKALNYAQWDASKLPGVVAPTPSPTPASKIAVTTLAGSGYSAYTDGIQGAASFLSPQGLTVDPNGNVFLADGNKIRKITPSGVVTTFAGSGYQNSVDGIGTAAGFWEPRGLTVDPNGNIYVADSYNRKIRKINPAGVVTTLAGSGASGYTDGIGTAASFSQPRGVVFNGGNLYVADGYKIRKISGMGVVTSVAAAFSFPYGLTVDTTGNVYTADSGQNIIYKITPSGVVTTLAGSGAQGSADGVGTAATFNIPIGLAMDRIGNIYVADKGNNKIRKITPSGVVTTFAGSGAQGPADGVGTAATFNEPGNMAFGNGDNLFVSDYRNFKIRKITISQ